jgi:hypothetical protein
MLSSNVLTTQHNISLAPFDVISEEQVLKATESLKLNVYLCVALNMMIGKK